MNGKTSVILASPPESIHDASSSGLTVAYMTYRIGRGFHLYRTDLPSNVRGGIMAVDDVGFSGDGSCSILAGEIIRECLSKKYSGIFLDVKENTSNLIPTLAEYLSVSTEKGGIRLYVPQWLGNNAKNAKVLLSSSIANGSLIQHIKSAYEKFGKGRVALDIQLTRSDYILSGGKKNGNMLTSEELKNLSEKYRSPSFFSKELCAYYFTYSENKTTHFVLYDNASSIKRKLYIAEKMDVDTAFLFYPEVKNMLRDIIS